MKYCPKCGYIDPYDISKCVICSHTEKFEINPKWEITKEKYKEIMNQYKYGEKTKEECQKELDEFCAPFYEETVKKRPEFDQELFEQRWVILERKNQEIANRHIDPVISRAVERAQSDSRNNAKCPYCKSYNTKKISAASRGLSFGLFGFGSGKVGKQWHCKSCKSDF